ncbi:MAG: hypothetical protein HOO06_07100 [Bdellovibrionaceae bacterium]|nr:hypothetical protein [Pseudobdellovibrionaceae bacterium]
MNKAPFVFILVFMILASVSVFAVSVSPSQYVICKNKKFVRTIRVEKQDDKGQCITKYTKAGIDRVIGSGIRMNSCQNFLKNVKGNLERANWSCREISKVQMSTPDISTEE